KQVYGNTWFTLFSPRIQNYTIGVEPVGPEWGGAAGPDANANTVVTSFDAQDNPGMRTQSLFRRAYEYEPEAAGMKGVPIQVWSVKTFTASWRRPIEGTALVTADL